MTDNPLDALVVAQKAGRSIGLTSVCSAHPYVLEASMLLGVAAHMPVLIEATSNQVNQYGGYTGMQPGDFVRFAVDIAERVGLQRHDLILGGDHLGPGPWAGELTTDAMRNARALVYDFAAAGCGKLHLDCSMPCADDREFGAEVAARRTAELAVAAELVCREHGLPPPRYVIGTEVPPAGGAKSGEAALTVTHPEDAAKTVELTLKAFDDQGLSYAWERVIALVVQPGVEFGDTVIHEYDRAAASGLTQFIETMPGVVYEAHSTDYQPREALKQLVEDHFAILKVGPALTFAFREAVFALAEMEEILFEDDCSHLRAILEKSMLDNPAYWHDHYRGSPHEQQFARSYSFSDRIRYYWAQPEVKAGFDKLIKNFGEKPLPLSLVSGYLPSQYDKIRARIIQNRARDLILDRVMDVLKVYSSACGYNSMGAE